MQRKTTYQSLGSGIFLIGLGILFLLPGVAFFPWILAVIGLAGLPTALAHQRGWYGIQGAFWLIGLAILFATNLLWPGILILIGLSTLAGALSRNSMGSPFAADVSDDEDAWAKENGAPVQDERDNDSEDQAASTRKLT